MGIRSQNADLKMPPICLLLLKTTLFYEGRVFMENRLLKNSIFFNHHHLLVEKHSSMINNSIGIREQTRVLCLGFVLL